MYPLRSYLRAMRYRAVGWGLGRNSGNVYRLLPMVVARIGDLAEATGQPLRLVGWSLGGYLAREAAREQPAAVERIVTLGSPVLGGPKHTVMAGRYRRLGFDVDRIEAEVEARYEIPLQVPVTAIYSRSDRIVAWRACIDPYSPNVEHLEVRCGHLGMGVSAEVYRLVARALAGERGRDTTSDPPTARESAKEGRAWNPPSSE
jgi:pimeloyl-ACP methyl ester carboxylesterase